MSQRRPIGQSTPFAIQFVPPGARQDWNARRAELRQADDTAFWMQHNHATLELTSVPGTAWGIMPSQPRAVNARLQFQDGSVWIAAPDNAEALADFGATFLRIVRAAPNATPIYDFRLLSNTALLITLYDASKRRSCPLRFVLSR